MKRRGTVGFLLVALLAMAGCRDHSREKSMPGAGSTAPAGNTGSAGANVREGPRAARQDRQRSRPPAEGDGNLEKIREEGTYENNLAGEVLEPFDAAELERLAKNPSSNQGRFENLLLRAGAAGDAGFKHLLEDKALRRDERLDLVLSAYDYNVNGSKAALEHILADQEAQNGKHGWDSNAIWVLAYIDEWDRVKSTLGARYLSGDGSSGDARYSFWLTRRALYPHARGFPKDYSSFQEEMSLMQKGTDWNSIDD